MRFRFAAVRANDSVPTAAIGAAGAARGHRLAYLDSVRGIAALSVVWYHFVLAYGVPGMRHRIVLDSPLAIWCDGPAAVSLFFVLSGFVLALKFTDASRLSRLNLRAYAAGRVFRIWLPYLVVLGLSALAMHWNATDWATDPAGSPWLHKQWSQPVSAAKFFREAVLVRPLSPDLMDNGAFLVVPQAWTLTIEITLSLLVPIAALVAARSVGWMLFAAALGAAVCGLSPFAVHFALGVALARWWTDGHVARWLSAPGARVACLGVGVLLYTFRTSVAAWVPDTFPESSVPVRLAAGVGALLLLALVLTAPACQRVLERGVLHHVGRVSYSVYLCHFAVQNVVVPRFFAATESLPGGFTVHWVAGIVFATANTLALATALYWIAEVPSIEAGRRFTAWLAGTPKGAPTAGTKPATRVPGATVAVAAGAERG